MQGNVIDFADFRLELVLLFFSRQATTPGNPDFVKAVGYDTGEQWAGLKGDGVAKPVELYTTAGCPYSAAAREELEWRGVDFVEYDVEGNRDAYERMLELTGGNRTVPVIVEEGKPVQVGWMGQGCFV